MGFSRALYLKRNAFAWCSCECRESFDGSAGDEGLVAAVNLGQRFLDQGNPKLVAFGLEENETI